MAGHQQDQRMVCFDAGLCCFFQEGTQRRRTATQNVCRLGSQQKVRKLSVLRAMDVNNLCMTGTVSDCDCNVMPLCRKHCPHRSKTFHWTVTPLCCTSLFFLFAERQYVTQNNTLQISSLSCAGCLRSTVPHSLC